jgi:hypothetical protein
MCARETLVIGIPLSFFIIIIFPSYKPPKGRLRPNVLMLSPCLK